MKLLFKLSVVPLLSTLLLAGVISISVENGRKNSLIIDDISNSVIPSIMYLKDIEGLLVLYRQNLMNAGMAGDLFELEAADSLANSLRSIVGQFDSVIPPELAKDTRLSHLIPQYLTMLSSFTADMIEGRFGDPQAMTNLHQNIESEIESIYGHLESRKSLNFESSAFLLQRITELLQLLFLFSILSFILNVAMSFFASSSIKKVSRSLSEMAKGEGDLTMRLSTKGRDEIAEMAYWFNKFVEKIAQIISTVQSDAMTLASSTEELSSISVELNDQSQDLKSKSDETASSSHSISNLMAEVDQSISELTDSITSVSASTEEMSSSIKEISYNTERTQSETDEAIVKVEASAGRVRQFQEMTGQISEIVEKVDLIARQTNLLAINAAVEAVAAGVAGRGFAVIAGEVKSLAEQSNNAAAEISRIISSVKDSIDTTTNDITDISSSISAVHEMVQSTALSLDSQAVTTNDIADIMNSMAGRLNITNDAVSSISRSVKVLDENALESSRSSEEVNAGSKTIEESTQNLREIAERLMAMVGKFKVH